MQYMRKEQQSWNCPMISLAICVMLGFILVQDVSAQSEMIRNNAGIRDFAAYWAATRLFLSGKNPYSPADLLELQKIAGRRDSSPLVMWNPPWTLSLTLPFGLIEFSASQFLWLTMHVFLLLASASRLWRLYGNPAGEHRLPWILAVGYIPTVFVLILGQITPLVLAGLVAFLYLEQRQKWFATGAVIMFATVKPHFIYLFWIVLGLWVYQQRRWQIALGAAIAFLITASFPLLFDPAIYSQFLDLHRNIALEKPLDLPSPSLRIALKLLFDGENYWLQFLPSVVALIWAVYYWRIHRGDWNWTERLPILLLVSVASSPYSWTFDQVIFLPAILQAASWIVHQRLPWYRSPSALVYLTIQTIHFLMRFYVPLEAWYFWLAPALLVNYLLFCAERRRNS